MRPERGNPPATARRSGVIRLPATLIVGAVAVAVGLMAEGHSVEPSYRHLVAPVGAAFQESMTAPGRTFASPGLAAPGGDSPCADYFPSPDPAQGNATDVLREGDGGGGFFEAAAAVPDGCLSGFPSEATPAPDDPAAGGHMRRW